MAFELSPTLCTSPPTELDRVSQTLTRRIRELADEVGEHLKRMGVVWS